MKPGTLIQGRLESILRCSADERYHYGDDLALVSGQSVAWGIVIQLWPAANKYLVLQLPRSQLAFTIQPFQFHCLLNVLPATSPGTFGQHPASVPDLLQTVRHRTRQMGDQVNENSLNLVYELRQGTHLKGICSFRLNPEGKQIRRNISRIFQTKTAVVRHDGFVC